jgi:tRNA(Ile)-lysidine synthase
MASADRDERKQLDLRAQMRATILKHKLVTHGDRLVLGVSGGADSLVLLHALRALRDEFDLRLHIAHLNHQLRGPDSDEDAEFVAALAREWKIPATIQARDLAAFARAQRLSIEELARRARYAFLAEVARRENAAAIAVAHNRDDQVETVLMHFIRGAGLAGLRGMQPKIEMRGATFGLAETRTAIQAPLYLIRPLLNVPRGEIDLYCKQHYLAPRVDRSNFDTVLFRNRLRQEVLPYLEALNPNLREVIYHSSIAIADDYDFLAPLIRNEYARVAQERDGAILFHRAAWSALHPAVQRGTLRLGVQRLRSDLRNIGWVHIEDARRLALEKAVGAEATLPSGLMLVVGYSNFVLADTAHGIPLPDIPLLHAKSLEVPPQGTLALPDSNWVVETEVTPEKPETQDRWTAVLDFAMCRGERALRHRRPGDHFQPAGMEGHTRSLHDFMIDEKIERTARALLPLLVVGDRIVWVCGLRVDERARVTPYTREFWRVTFRKKIMGV